MEINNLKNIFENLEKQISIGEELKIKERKQKEEVYNKILEVLETEYNEVWNLFNKSVNSVYYKNNNAESLYFSVEQGKSKIQRISIYGMEIHILKDFYRYSIETYIKVLRILKENKENLFKALESELNKALNAQQIRNTQLNNDLSQAKEELQKYCNDTKTYKIVITIIEE
jgi:hypothetical protein